MASLRPYKSVEKWILHWGWTLNGKRYRIKKESSWKNPSDRKRPPPALQQQYLDESPLKSGHSEESIYLLKEVYPWQGNK